MHEQLSTSSLSEPETSYLTRYLADQKSSYFTLSAVLILQVSLDHHITLLYPTHALQYSQPAPIQAADKEYHRSQVFTASSIQHKFRTKAYGRLFKTATFENKPVPHPSLQLSI